mmetsp:Transcript_10483/g.25598  ORF Transcript_10483/g.25598 Transcript_10483/m.25598 type:complete len:93 (+) Transcript_10483:485-763(+)
MLGGHSENSLMFVPTSVTQQNVFPKSPWRYADAFHRMEIKTTAWSAMRESENIMMMLTPQLKTSGAKTRAGSPCPFERSDDLGGGRCLKPIC